MAKRSHSSSRKFENIWRSLSSEEEEEEERIQELNVTDDPIWSQKMSQLLTITKDKKELLMQDIKTEIEKIPVYLTKQNESFRQMINHVRSTTRTVISNNLMEELRKMAILIYKIMIIQTYHLLWTAYLKSGLGQLIIPSQEPPPSYSTTLHIWPNEMKALLQLRNNTNENEIYLTFVNEQLHELDHQLKQCQAKLNMKANHFEGYTLAIQKIIETYIEQNLHSFRMRIEHQIELIHYDYRIRALKLEYLRHTPNGYQEQIMKELCQSKYEQETTEQEYNFLKQQINYYNLPAQSFDNSSIAQSPLIDSIEDVDIRQQLYKQYKEVAVQAKANLFQLYMKSAEDEREEYGKKYEYNVKKMWSDYHSLDDNKKIPWIMIQLINERCDKINERIKCIYTFKAQSIQA